LGGFDVGKKELPVAGDGEMPHLQIPIGVVVAIPLQGIIAGPDWNPAEIEGATLIGKKIL
jgi:hypothetical protein